MDLKKLNALDFCIPFPGFLFCCFVKCRRLALSTGSVCLKVKVGFLHYCRGGAQEVFF